MHETWALVVAAGRGERFGGDRPKQYREMGGKSLLRHSVEAFLGHPDIAGVLVVIDPGHGRWYEEAVGDLALPPPVPGGATRQDSVLNGLNRLAEMPVRPDRVLIHDAARPLVSAATIASVVLALDNAPGAIAAVAVTDTLKRADGDGMITATVERTGMWRAQTPQGFRFTEILGAHRAMAGRALSDDAAVADAAGLAVRIVPDSAENVKITMADDLDRAERALAQGSFETRVGAGFDVHRLQAGTAVTLCGVRIAHDRCLEGHSDADVGLHALTDALLGAIGQGDIGSHFPPSDHAWRGADSARFLGHAAALVAGRGGSIVNVDVTLLCERPKIGPHRSAMQARIAEILGIEADRVSVKATTTERLGFTGREEGIAAQAVAAVRLPVRAKRQDADDVHR